jgi:hypothetical protein
VLFVALLSLACIRLVYVLFEGIVIAKLPFEPISLISGLTHYGLPGDNLHDCSMTFIFVLMNLTVGNYAKKLIGLEGERVVMPQASPWG